MSDLLDAALAYAARGWPVFPCLPLSKVPATGQGGFKNATTDPAQIEAWWTESPNYNIAFSPRDAGLSVVDLDPAKEDLIDGKEAWTRKCEEQGEPDETFTVGSPRDGEHKYYRGDLPPSTGKATRGLIPGAAIDTRGGGSYVLLPPSRTSSKVNPQYGDGEYRVINDSPIAPLPFWVAERAAVMRTKPTVAPAPETLDDPTDMARAQTYLGMLPEARLNQGADDATYDAACVLRDFGLSEAVAQTLMADHYKIYPILPETAEWVAFKTHNAYRYAQNSPGTQAVGSAAHHLDQIKAPEPDPPAFKFRHPGQLARLKRSPSLIDGILPAQGTGILYAPPGSFKSFIALGMAFAVATGRAAFARYSVNRTGPVIYCAGEGHLAVATQRLPALFTQHGIPMTEETPLYLLNGVPLACGDETAAQFIASVHSQIKEPPALLVIDTMARSLAGLKENDASEAGRFVDLIETLASNLECFVLAVGHEGKDGSKGVRGSSAVEAGVDVIWQARRPSETSSGVSLHSKKDKDGDTHGVVYLLGQKVGDSVVFAAKEEAEWNQSSGKRPGVVSASDVGHALDDLGAREGKTVNNRILAEHLAGPSGDENTIGAKEKALKRGIMVGNLLSYVVHQSIGTRDPTLWSIPSTDQE